MKASGYRGALVSGLLLALASLDALAQGKLVCWTDKAGRRACGNTVPPEYAAQERTILNKQGQVVRTIPGQATPEQIAAKEAALKRAEENKRADEKRAAYERGLMQSYSRPEDLAALRDERIAAIDGSMKLRQAAIQRDQAALSQLRKRLPGPDSKKKVPASLPKQIKEFEVAVAENERSLADLRQRRDATCSNFDHDIRRFQELKSGTVSFHSPCPQIPVGQ